MNSNNAEEKTIKGSQIIAENSIWLYWKEGNKIFRGKRKNRRKYAGFFKSDPKIKVEKIKASEESYINKIFRDRQKSRI